MTDKLREAISPLLTHIKARWEGGMYFDAATGLTEKQKGAHLAIERLLDFTEAIEAALAESEWHPMETAPKDGTEILIKTDRPGRSTHYLVGHYMPGGRCIEDHPPISEGWHFWNGYMFDRASKPISWQPLPENKP